ncbi:hypothetical protein D3C81_1940140 [compost metagenome]
MTSRAFSRSIGIKRTIPASGPPAASPKMDSSSLSTTPASTACRRNSPTDMPRSWSTSNNCTVSRMLFSSSWLPATISRLRRSSMFISPLLGLSGSRIFISSAADM